MKRNLIIRVLMAACIIVLIYGNFSYAAIQIKDVDQSTLTNKTISEFYDMAIEMKNAGQGLEGTTVDVKMSNNYEWAVVSYFSNSSYGTAGEGENTGKSIDTSVKTHYSTNGNITGVMDWGKTYSFTAGIISNYASVTFSDTISSNGASIIANASTDKVDKFANIVTNYEIAKTGWYNPGTNRAGSDAGVPYSFRSGLFGFFGGTYGDGAAYRDTGRANSDVTFRPIFYN